MSNPNLPINAKYNTYIGARYVPLMGGEWNIDNSYEPLVVVTYQGSSYTSNTFVPAGTDINNTTYWTKTGDYNAQVEQYRQEVNNLNNTVNNLNSAVNELSDQMTINQNATDIKLEGIKSNLKSTQTTVAAHNITLSNLMPQAFGLMPENDTYDIMVYDNGIYASVYNNEFPINHSIIDFSSDTILPPHKNNFIILPYTSPTPDNFSYISSWCAKQIEANPHCKWYIMLSGISNPKQYEWLTFAHYHLANTATANYVYIPEMFVHCVDIDDTLQGLWVSTYRLVFRYAKGINNLTASAVYFRTYGDENVGTNAVRIQTLVHVSDVLMKASISFSSSYTVTPTNKSVRIVIPITQNNSIIASYYHHCDYTFIVTQDSKDITVFAEIWLDSINNLIIQFVTPTNSVVSNFRGVIGNYTYEPIYPAKFTGSRAEIVEDIPLVLF